jgi:hypothetical protein
MASFSIVLKPSVERDLRSLPKSAVPRVLRAIEALKDDPFPIPPRLAMSPGELRHHQRHCPRIDREVGIDAGRGGQPHSSLRLGRVGRIKGLRGAVGVVAHEDLHPTEVPLARVERHGRRPGVRQVQLNRTCRSPCLGDGYDHALGSLPPVSLVQHIAAHPFPDSLV